MHSQHHNNKKQSGYVALISVIIISAILMMLALGLSQNAVAFNFILLDTEQKEQSYYAGISCINEAKLKLSTIPSYEGKESFAVSSSTVCTIDSVSQDQGMHKIEVEDRVNNAYTVFTKDI